MTQVQTDQLITYVFKDQAGEYFLVPHELIEQRRVPAEQKAELERAIAEAAPIGGNGDDAQGFLLPVVGFTLIAAAIITVDGVRRALDMPQK